MEVYSIETGNFMVDGGAMFGIITKTIWQKIYPENEKNLCNIAMRCLLVVDGDRRILIDNGTGDKQDENFFKYSYLNGDDTLEKSLAKYGFSTDDITDVVMSHLHYDHCGGAVKWNNEKTGYQLNFKNADYWISKAQWDLFLNPNDREKSSFFDENVLPIKESGRLRLIEKEQELFPNFEVRLFDGHTDGQIIPLINYNGRIIVYASDLIPVVASIPLVYVSAYDVRPLISIQEKEAFLEEALENNYVLFFEHDLYNECCSLHRTNKGIREKECFALAKLK